MGSWNFGMKGNNQGENQCRTKAETMRFERLPTTSKRLVRVVIETPRGSAAKIAYDPASQVFEYSRPLPVGTVYPYDWGFIPSTRGEDGDPLDGLVIHMAATAPGVVIKCDLLGCIAVEQRDADGTVMRNDRFVLSPHKLDAPYQSVADDQVNRQLRAEIEHFFASVVLGTGKSVSFKRWQGTAEAWELIKQSQKAFRRS